MNVGCDHPTLTRLASRLAIVLLMERELACIDCGRVFTFGIHNGQTGFTEV